MGKIKWLILDLDETLIGSRKYGYNIYNKARLHVAKLIARQTGLEVKKVYDEITKIKFRISNPKYNFVPIQNSRALWIKYFKEKYNLKISEKKLEKEYWDFFMKHISFLPYVKPTLKKLRDKYKIAIFTNSDGLKETKLRRIKKFGLEKLAHKVILTDDLMINKPQPEAFLALLNRLKVSEKEVVYVGDDPLYELIPVKKLGITTVMVRAFKYPKKISKQMLKYVDFSIKSIRELPPILERLD